MKLKVIPYLIFTQLLILSFSCKKTPDLKKVTNPVHGLITEKAMVVSAREEASKIGSDIMKKGLSKN